MTHDLNKSVIAILQPDGTPVGTGFLVTDGLAVTCAHVVVGAESKPGEALFVRFAQTGSESRAVVLDRGWIPVETGDIAFLQVERVPAEVTPVTLGSAAGCQGHPSTSLGYPKHERGKLAGSRDTIIALLAAEVPPRLQLQSAAVEEGFSGATVLDLDKDRVVGMLAWGRDQKHAVRVLAVPAGQIVAAWAGAELALVEAEPERAFRAGRAKPGELPGA